MKSQKTLSRTILEFGKPIISQLPKEHTVKDFERALRIIITVWNAITYDACNDNSEGEKELMIVFGNLPNGLPTFIEQLISRKKRNFSSDLRSVGERRITVRDGRFLFDCNELTHERPYEDPSTLH